MLVALGLGVVVVRRRSVAVALVSVQASGYCRRRRGGVERRRGGDRSRAGGTRSRPRRATAVRRRAHARTAARARAVPLARAGLAVALALTLIWLVPPVGLESSDAERAALALVAFGLIAATRRATLLQVVGIVLVENALALAALSSGTSSLVIELGVALDLMLVALVAAVFHERIFAEFGAGDTAELRTLRD